MIQVGFSHDIDGVQLWTVDPETGIPLCIFKDVSPEYAREIAMNLTLESIACEELRQKNQGA